MSHRYRAAAKAAIAALRGVYSPPGLLFVILILLFLPALYYSLDTPFDLIDDYGDSGRLRNYRSFGAFFSAMRDTFADGEIFRFRPFYDWYVGAAWKVFGPTPGLHHLAPWVWHFAALFVFAAALLRFAPSGPADNAGPGDRMEGRRLIRRAARMAGRIAPLLPLAFLLYIWFFFPNTPAARLSNQEVYTVFFLGLCTWVAALALTAEPGRDSPRKWRLLYALFCLGYAGLVFSKEANMGVALWLLLAYLGYARYAARTAHRSGWKLLLGAAPLALLFILSLSRISAAIPNNDVIRPTPTPILPNIAEIMAGLFQTETSLLITAVFSLLAAGLLFTVARQARQRTWNSETAFVLLLLGQFAAMLLLLSIAWGVSLRYWYILLPVFAMLLAFGVKYLLQWCAAGGPGLRWNADGCPRLHWQAEARPGLRNFIVLGLAAFLVFFVAANYYNFLWQTLIQHSSRQADSRLLARTTQLLQAGEYVTLHATDVRDNLSWQISGYYHRFLPRFRGEEYEIRRRPPADPARPYYLAAMQQHPLPLPADTAITHNDDYAVLSAARRVSGWLQGDAAYTAKDHGVYYPGEYRWSIYRLPHNLDDYAAGLAGELGEPAAAGGGWQVYLTDNRLIYYNAACSPDAAAATFLLHLTPQNAADLPQGREEYGFDNRDFRFGPHGVRSEATCLVLKELPEYAIGSLRTGQYVDGDNPLWRVEFPATR